MLIAALQAAPQSPREATRRYVVAHVSRNAAVTFHIVARSGVYAIVRFTLNNYGGGGADFLAKHFPFGWQLIDQTMGPVRFLPCELRGHGLLPRDVRAMMPALSPRAPNMEDCNVDKDLGRYGDITDVRRIIPDDVIVRAIRVADGWAVSDEDGMIGRDRLFRRGAQGRWAFVASGPMNSVATLERLGVPKKTAVLLEKE